VSFLALHDITALLYDIQLGGCKCVFKHFAPILRNAKTYQEDCVSSQALRKRNLCENYRQSHE